MAQAINGSGEVVGESHIADGDSHAFLWTAAGGIEDLGTLGGHDSSAAAINTSGQVVGTSDLTMSDGSDRDPFLWTAANGMQDLGSLGIYGEGSLLNDSGQVVGTFDSRSDNYAHTFVWSTADGMQELPSLLGGTTIPYAEESNGDVVGFSEQPPYGDDATHAFLWTPAGGVQDLGTLGGTQSSAFAANDNGLIVGSSTTSSGRTDCVAWTSPTQIVDLGTIGGVSCQPSAVSNSGQIVGYFQVSSGVYHAFSGTVAGGLRDIGGLGGTFANADAVNDSGQVVGYAVAPDGSSHAFSWTAKYGLIDLNSLAGEDASNARAINDSGQIVGQASSNTPDSNGDYTGHPVLWQNVSGPAAPAFASVASTTTTYGVPFTYSVVTSGNPAAKLTKSGALPPGVTFTDDGGGNATLAGTPTGSASGTYHVSITARNTSGTAVQSFTLIVAKAPKITHIPNITAAVGSTLTLGITTSGYPNASVTEFGALPSGVGFTDNGDGTATINGTPAIGSGASYPIVVTATNPTATTTQTFTLKVNEAPAFTSAASSSATIGSPFSFIVSTVGYPTPRLSKSGVLPAGITFSAATGTFSGTPKAKSAGSYPVTITATNTNGAASQQFTITVS